MPRLGRTVALLIGTLGVAWVVNAQTLSAPTVQPFQTSLTLPAGNSVYIYAMATGGAYGSSNLSQGSYQQVLDADGLPAAALAVTSVNSNAFTTGAAYYSIGGVGVSGFTNISASYGANNAPGASAVSDTFVLTQPSLVVVVAMAGGEAYLTVSGLPGLQVDAQAGNPSGGTIPITIAHASLSPGTYTVAEASVPSPAGGQDPNHMADLIGVFVFTGSGSAGSGSAPTAPTGLAATVSGSTVVLTWTAPTSGGVPTSYILQAGSVSGLSNLANGNIGPGLSFTAPNVPPGMYFVRVLAQNASGTSPPSNEAVVTVAGGCVGVPGAPTGLTATANGATVTLTWQAPSGGCSVTSYILQAGSTSGQNNLANFATGVATTGYVASNVPAGTYYVRVLAADAAGTGSPSNEVVVIVSPGLPVGVWTLVWADECGGSGPIDTSLWQYDIGTGYLGGPSGWGTNEVEMMSATTANVSQDGKGHCTITPLSSSSGGWTSGRIETNAIFQAPANGGLAIEASIQQPNVSGIPATGYWPAFWLLGAHFRPNYSGWPGVGEIDVMEDINGLSELFTTFHCGTSPGGPCNEKTGLQQVHSCAGCQTGFHVYRVEVDIAASPQEIRWYLDGSLVHTVQSTDIVDPDTGQIDSAAWTAAINYGFFIILDVAMGGDWPGNPTSNTSSGAPMLVDYVRVYQRPD